MPFWEGATLEWSKQYAFAGVKLFVVGGDRANWIRMGDTPECKDVIRTHSGGLCRMIGTAACISCLCTDECWRRVVRWCRYAGTSQNPAGNVSSFLKS